MIAQAISKTGIQDIFNKQKANVLNTRKSRLKERLDKLKRIDNYITDAKNNQRLIKAIQSDFYRPETEILMSEIGVVQRHSAFIQKHLRSWMRDEYVPAPMVMAGTKSYIHRESKGCCLIIAPWNYPFNLAVMPVLYAIAAGNNIIIKPSEYTPNTANFIEQMFADLFDENEIRVIQGEVETSTELLALPFDHIFFTGSPNVGKIVMAAAARNLTSVTLELGGKSPVIVDETVNAKTSAEKVTWGKCFNAGQTCIAPDYAFIHKSKMNEFVQGFEDSVNKFYGDSTKDMADTKDYCQLVNARNFGRIKALVDDAVSKGAKVAVGGKMNTKENYISPTLLTGVTEDMDILHEEIFGPVLPVMSYSDQKEVVDFINNRPKPLSMYIESKSKKNMDFFVNNTSAGGTVINDLLLGYLNPDLPFGGVNNSGIGKAFGKHGFNEYSNERGVIRRSWGTSSILFPPYTDKLQKLVGFMNKWL